MLRKITLSKSERDSIAHADGLGEKTHAWRQVRVKYGLPDGQALGVERSEDGAALYLKGSYPRKYAVTGESGRWVDFMTDDGLAAHTRAVTTPDAATQADTTFFASDATRSSVAWRCIDRDSLLEMLRDIGSPRTVSVPPSFGALGLDALVLSKDGTLYYREA